MSVLRSMHAYCHDCVDSKLCAVNGGQREGQRAFQQKQIQVKLNLM